jgi:hypothetical protein
MKTYTSGLIADTEKIACTLGEQDLANRIVQTQQQLASRATRVIELENGYRWEYPSDDDAVLRDLSEWIVRERKCCSFFRFELTIEPGGSTSLAVTGKPGVKDFIAAAMNLK